MMGVRPNTGSSRRSAFRRWPRRVSSIDRIPDMPASTSRPRVVIFSASVGSGHIRAAQAIETALTRIDPEVEVTHIDVLALANRAFRSAYGAGYFRAVERAPNLIGMLYDMLDQPGNGGMSAKARLMFERVNLKRLGQLLSARAFDLAINTHFLPPELIGWARRAGRINLPQVTVVTDFDVHGMWVNDPCERYFVATNEARANVMGWGVNAERIDVTGIPIDPAFASPIDRIECRRRLGWAIDRPVVLQMAGGFGVGSIERIFQSVCDVEAPLNVAVVTGKNSAAKSRLEAIQAPRRHNCRILGYTTEMRLLMGAADVVVSKPGGLTTSECLACGCAMLVVEPIPGQEDRNSDFLLENGCAIKVNNLSSLTHKLGTLLQDRSRLLQIQQAARHCAQPDAAFEIASRCLKMLNRAPLRRSPGVVKY